MKIKLDKTYDPKKIENKLYNSWIENKYFSAKIDNDKKPFTIVMPPPNITGQLHMGHALDNTLQDIIIRMKRMQGYSALWQPGTDHASIATEIKILEALSKEGITKENLSREEFLVKAWEWKEKYANRIIEQLKKIGSSCDWDRVRFTMDEGCSKAVYKFFKKLYDDGLIYKDNKIINWCPKCKTTISDAEVDYVEKDGNFYHIKYIFSDEEGYLDVATTRPETLLGDTAIVVHPNDNRYKHLVGKKVILPIVNKVIPIIADEYVDIEFGTGVVKATPAHDPNDYEVGVRNNLDIINILNDDGTMNSNAYHYEGMDRYECRKAIVEELKNKDLLIKIEPIKHNVGTHERCCEDIEPMVKHQWFVKMDELAKQAISALDNDLTFVPKHFEKIYLHWLNNIRDWCISRQLWWGHRIPAYYCNDCGHVHISDVDINECEKCGGININQDEDTLDTWFSSALWPFSTLGWPDNTEDFKYFYPTNVLVTGYDIIFFWVVRMVFSGIYNTDKTPFKEVLIHGLVRDSLGRKMSKSLGNGIDPLEVIDKYGADALRYSLISGNSSGTDIRYYESKVESARNFANKIWNASRFIMMHIDKYDANKPLNFTIEDKWILHKLNSVIKEVTINMENFDLGIAIDKINSFIWEEFCDWYIEMVKPRLFNQDETTNASLYTLKHVLENSLKLLHPYMPFITEEIYSNVFDQGSIMISKWPEFDEKMIFEKEFDLVQTSKDAIKAIRNIRADMNIPPSKKTDIYITLSDKTYLDAYSSTYFEKLSYANKIIITDNIYEDDNLVSLVINKSTVYLPLDELVDKDKEIERLNKDKSKIQSEIKRCDSMLSNEKFILKAPKIKVDEEKNKLIKYKEQLKLVEEQLEKLKK